MPKAACTTARISSARRASEVGLISRVSVTSTATATPHLGFVNGGFETGDLTGWRPGNSGGIPGARERCKTANGPYRLLNRSQAPQHGHPPGHVGVAGDRDPRHVEAATAHRFKAGFGSGQQIQGRLRDGYDAAAGSEIHDPPAPDTFGGAEVHARERETAAPAEGPVRGMWWPARSGGA